MLNHFTKIRALAGLSMFLMIIAATLVRAQNGPIFRIGVLDEERGPIADGARMAINEINSLGGVRGADGTFFQLELIIQPPGENLSATLPSLRDASIIALLGP